MRETKHVGSNPTAPAKKTLSKFYMDTMEILGLVFLGIIILLVVGGVVIDHLSRKEKEEAWYLIDNFETVRKLKKTNPSEFIEKSFKIITGVKPGHWHGFRVKQSRHGNGWFVEGDYFNGKRFWPSGDKLGQKFYPDSYLSKAGAEEELLNVLERLTDFIIYWEKSGREFDARRED